MDRGLVDSALVQVREFNYVFSMLVARHDSLVLEYYRTGLTQYNDYQIRSITKSVVSLLVGITIGEGQLKDVDVPFLSLFPEYRQAGQDPRKDSLTIRHLLSMRAGIDFEDDGRNASIVAASDDWIRAFIGLPFLTSPGDTFAYSSLQSHLLSAAVSRVSGMTTEEYARKKLFEPMHISLRSWDRGPLGYHIGGTGISLTARDLLRVGHLVLRRGAVDGRRIIPEAWLDSMEVPRNQRTGRWGDLQRVNYGYQWWLGMDMERHLTIAAGYGGQFLIIDRDRDIVIATTCDTDVDPITASVRQDAILNVLLRYVLSAVRS